MEDRGSGNPLERLLQKLRTIASKITSHWAKSPESPENAPEDTPEDVPEDTSDHRDPVKTLKRATGSLDRSVELMRKAEEQQREVTGALNALNEFLKAWVDRIKGAESARHADTPESEIPEYCEPREFTHREYLEFVTVEEFEKFRFMPTITQEDIDNTDWDKLLPSLLEEC